MKESCFEAMNITRFSLPIQKLGKDLKSGELWRLCTSHLTNDFAECMEIINTGMNRAKSLRRLMNKIKRVDGGTESRELYH